MGTNTISIIDFGIDCPTEERLIRNKLAGIARLFSLMTRKPTVQHTLTDTDIVDAVFTDMGASR
jgi:hypothetical protein